MPAAHLYRCPGCNTQRRRKPTLIDARGAVVDWTSCDCHPADPFRMVRVRPGDARMRRAIAGMFRSLKTA